MEGPNRPTEGIDGAELEALRIDETQSQPETPIPILALESDPEESLRSEGLLG